MARNFLSLPFAPYQGVYTSKPFNAGRGGNKGLMVATDLLWPTYKANGNVLGNANPNFVVIVDLNGAGPNSVSQLWNIESVYIDNEGVDFPVYVYFTDTQFTVSCPANSAGWYQVFTNARRVYIAGVGISDSAIVANQRTRLFFTDVQMVPSLDQEIASAASLELASANISRGNVPNNPNFGIPALGDQTDNATLNMSGLGTESIILAPIAATSGFIYLTHLSASVILNGLFTLDQAVQLTTDPLPPGGAGIWTWVWQARAGQAGMFSFPAMNNGNIKLAIGPTYVIRQVSINSSGDNISVNAVFSTNPN